MAHNHAAIAQHYTELSQYARNRGFALSTVGRNEENTVFKVSRASEDITRYDTFQTLGEVSAYLLGVEFMDEEKAMDILPPRFL